MDMEIKSVEAELKALDDSGEGVLRFIKFHQEDKDSDITLPGFIGSQEAILITNHNWKSDLPPLGRGESFEADGATNFRFKLNLDDPRAQVWRSWLKMDRGSPRPLQQISYGFSPYSDGQERGQKDGRQVRYLKPRADGTPGAKLHEVSFVVVGAGNDTAVLTMKSQEPMGDVPDVPLSQALTQEGTALSQMAPLTGEALTVLLKNLTDEQLHAVYRSRIEHKCFIQDMRSKRGKMLAADTIKLIDELSTDWDRLRAKVRLGAVKRDSIYEELEARYDKYSAIASRREDERRAQERLENDQLYQGAMSRLEKIQEVLHP